MTPAKILVQLLPDLFPGRSLHWWQRAAAAGQLGPVHVEAGHVRNRTVDADEIQRRFGAITDDQFAAAVQAYEGKRRLVRKIEP